MYDSSWEYSSFVLFLLLDICNFSYGHFCMKETSTRDIEHREPVVTGR